MIQLLYGNRQQFRFRHNDINLLGYSDAQLPVKRSSYQLNSGSPIHFYVEFKPKPGGKKYPWGTETPSVHRLRNRPGHFNLEIPIDCPELQEGWNTIGIEIEDAEGKIETLDAEFHWESHPVPLPLNLQDLSPYQNIQEIGQAVNGAFEIDRERNAICSLPRVASDILLLLSSPNGSQEATYEVRFSNTKRGAFLGLSDFFVRHDEQSPGLGIKPGYSTAGLATITPQGWVQAWMAVGDCLMNTKGTWVVKTEYPARMEVEPEVTYCVRHQVLMAEGINCVRYRMWLKGEPEPDRWLCDENTAHLNPKLSRHTQASFGLFQYWGLPTEWSKIEVKPLEVDAQTLDYLRRQKNSIIRFSRTVRGAIARLLHFLRIMVVTQIKTLKKRRSQ